MKKLCYGIEIDLSKDALFTEFANTLLDKYYLAEGETSPQEGLARAAVAFSGGDLEFAQQIYDDLSNQYFTLSSPILSNAPKPGEEPRALPISCFLLSVPDTVPGLIKHSSLVRWLSVKGGGIGASWSKIRPASKKAPGPIPFLRTIDADMVAWRQGSVRRGSAAVYMDVSHPDIVEFINMRMPTGGDINRKCLNLFNGVSIPDEFMEKAQTNQLWDLVDPSNGKIHSSIPARELYQRILDVRSRTGGPFIYHKDAAYRGLPQYQKDMGCTCDTTNLCTEITLPTGRVPGEELDRVAVCCLASLNAAFWRTWRDTGLVGRLVRFLDNVLQYFIDHAPPEIAEAAWSAFRERAIGIGTLGFHDLLQQENVPFESALATSLNIQLARDIYEQAVAMSEQLAHERGPCPDAGEAGVMRRNSHLIAPAPNANSSTFVDASPSIEPRKSNAFVHRTRAGTFLVKNKNLEKVIDRLGLSEEERKSLWQDIVIHDGSIQHLDKYFDEWTRSVYKTAIEIDQMWIIEHAAERLPYICQSQSINLFFPPGADRNYVLQVHFKAWQKGLKTLYYYRTHSSKVVTKISKNTERVAISDLVKDDEECIACQA
jgi:ribonucleoside-diphosphate reductase alpha chain